MSRLFLTAFLLSLGLTAVVNAFPPPPADSAAEADAIERCNAPSAIEEAVNCWMADPDGSWLTGPDALDAQTPLKNADWNQFVETALRTERNFSKAINRVFQSSGGVQSIMLGFALQADEAIYGENAVELRGKMCGALHAFVGCASKHGARCQDAANTRLARLPDRLGLTDFNLPPTANMGSIMQLATKVLCYICNEKDEREGLKVLLGTALDGNKRKQATEAMKPDNRLKVYSSCQIPGQPPLAQRPQTNEQYMQLIKERPCEFAPYFHCLAEDVHGRINPGVVFNPIDGVGNITMNHLFNCQTQQPSYDCKKNDEIQSYFKGAGGAAAGRSSWALPGTTDAAAFAQVSLFAALLSVVLPFLIIF